MGQDYVARKAAKKQRKRSANQDGSSKPRRERKKANQPRRNCRGMCFQQPLITEDDRKWNGKEDGANDDDAAAAAAGFDIEDMQEQLASAQEQSQKEAGKGAKPDDKKQQQPGASKKRKNAPADAPMKLSTGVQLLSPAAAAASGPGAKAGALQLNDVPAALLPFHQLIQTAMMQLGHVEATPVQALCWPVGCAGHDVQAVAEPGSGKTLAYLLPAAVRLAESGASPADGPLLLVLTPTRELALQIWAQAKALGRSMALNSAVVYGGADRAQQVQALQKQPHILIATPGRLLDLCDAGALALSHVQCVVLDEADKMLSLGFEPQLQRLHGMLLERAAAAAPPAKRRKGATAKGGKGDGSVGGSRPQVMLFTATMPEAVAGAAAQWLRPDADKIRASLTAEAISRTVTQVVHVCAEHKKPTKLLKHLAAIKEQSIGMRNPPRVIIFANKTKTVRFIVDTVGKEGYRVAELHGKRSQAEREEAIQGFRAGKVQVLVATDVAARGLDVRGLPYVVNYDFPSSLDSYIHRVGRTGRLAAKGHAYSFFTRNLARLAPDLTELLQHHGQALDPNLVQLADAWRAVEQQLRVKGGDVKAAAVGAEAEGDDKEEEELGDAEHAADAVPEDLQEGLPAAVEAAKTGKRTGKKQKQQGQQEQQQQQQQQQPPPRPGSLLRPLHSNDYEAAFLQLITDEQAGKPGDAAASKASKCSDAEAGQVGPAAVAKGSKRLRISGVVSAFEGAFASLLSPVDSEASEEEQEEEGQHGLQAAEAAGAPAAGAGKRQKAKASKGAELLVPRPAAGPGGDGTSAEAAAFMPSRKFLGSKKGYVFKLGPRGLGYYVDKPSVVAGKAAKQPKQQLERKQKQQQAKQPPAAQQPRQQGKQAKDPGELRLVVEADDDSSDDDVESEPQSGRAKHKSLPGRLRKKLAKMRANAAGGMGAGSEGKKEPAGGRGGGGKKGGKK